MAAAAAADEAAGRIFIKDLPEDHAEYSNWRYTLCAQVLKASPDPMIAMQYIQELDNPAIQFGDLAAYLNPVMNRVDVGLFAAVVGAIQKGPEAKEQMKRIQARAAFGCGRQAVRILDEQHQHEATRKATKANTEIQKLTCSGLDDLSAYMASFQLLRHQMGADEHKLRKALGISLLKERLRGINELKATFALWNAQQNDDLDQLVAAIDVVLAECTGEIKGQEGQASSRGDGCCSSCGRQGRR